MTKFTPPTDLPNTERLFKAGYFTLAENLAYYLWRGTPLTKSEREELEAGFRSGPNSLDPLEAYELWEVESDFHELVEALTGAVCPPSRPDLIGLPGGAREARAREKRSNKCSLRTWTEARLPSSERLEGDNARALGARAPDAA
jgi:hypothetical protein